MRTRSFLSLLSALVFLASGLEGQSVVRCPDAHRSLGERLRWASSECARLIGGKEYWIGYSIKRLMHEGSYLSSGSLYSGDMDGTCSLNDVVAGDTSRHGAGDRMWGGVERNELVKVLKEVAILARISGNLGDDGSLKKLNVSDMELHADLRNEPLLWLGGADDDQSVALLIEFFGRQSSVDLRKDLLTAIGIHQNSRESFSFLVTVLRGEQTDNVRSQAAFWIGQQNRPECLRVLTDAAQDDRSAKVREQSVFALSQLSSEESVESLIALARGAKDMKVRAKAAFWLGQKASLKAVATFESIIADDEEIDVQRQALYALAQIRTPEGADRVIIIANTHPNLRIRKQAIQCLGQSKDPRALDALIAIVRK
ncbi:MAG: HEAT repeat domain-containing protein [Ignavibacteriales bacterium]|nr:HEAT repeat domain-containing protein [Ignavibacteriales bacterium]